LEAGNIPIVYFLEGGGGGGGGGLLLLVELMVTSQVGIRKSVFDPLSTSCLQLLSPR
jgi:hypothetical protein